MAPKSQLKKMLTEVELQIMSAVWSLGECTVKQVQEALPRDRPLAYTSVATMMKILEGKKVLKSQKGERAHTYLALLKKEDYEFRTVRHLTQNLFDGNASGMVMRLIDASDLSADEIKKIQALLRERLPS